MSIGNDELRMIREARDTINAVLDDIDAEPKEARYDLYGALASLDDAMAKFQEGGAAQ